MMIKIKPLKSDLSCTLKQRNVRKNTNIQFVTLLHIQTQNWLKLVFCCEQTLFACVLFHLGGRAAFIARACWTVRVKSPFRYLTHTYSLGAPYTQWSVGRFQFQIKVGCDLNNEHG